MKRAVQFSEVTKLMVSRRDGDGVVRGLSRVRVTLSCGRSQYLTVGARVRVLRVWCRTCAAWEAWS